MPVASSRKRRTDQSHSLLEPFRVGMTFNKRQLNVGSSANAPQCGTCGERRRGSEAVQLATIGKQGGLEGPRRKSHDWHQRRACAVDADRRIQKSAPMVTTVDRHCAPRLAARKGCDSRKRALSEFVLNSDADCVGSGSRVAARQLNRRHVR